jgi:hypothetical protein
VIGGGNTAVEEALFLTHFASRSRSSTVARVLPRRAHPPGPAVQEPQDRGDLGLGGRRRARRPGTPTRRKVTGACESAQRQDRRRPASCKVDGVFVAIGHSPATELVQGDQLRDEAERLRLDRAGSRPRPSVPGVFAAGDVTDEIYRQAVTAAGLGCMAALEAERFLAAVTEGLQKRLPNKRRCRSPSAAITFCDERHGLGQAQGSSRRPRRRAASRMRATQLGHVASRPCQRTGERARAGARRAAVPPPRARPAVDRAGRAAPPRRARGVR